MTAEEFNRLLREKRVPELLCLYGEESFLVNQAARRVRQVLFPTGVDDFNDHRFEGKSCRAEQVLDAAETLPVFATRRLVTISEAHLLPAAEQDRLMGYLANPVPETCLLLVAEKIDGRRKFFQQFKKVGVLVEFKGLSERDLPRHVKNYLDEKDIEISADALSLFCATVGERLQEVHSELDKLITYIGRERLIDSKDVQAVVSRGRAENIFNLGNAVGRGDTAGALELTKRLGGAGEAPLRILALLVRHFRQLWKVRELSAQHCPQKEIASIARIPFFVVDGLVLQAKRFSRQDFMAAFELFLETDLAMKSSGADADALLDSLILRLTKRKTN